jgi:uncharacterized membrane protein
VNNSTDPKPLSLRQASGKAMWAALRRLLRTRIVAGVLTVLPIWVTWAVLKFVFTMMKDATEPLAAWLARMSAENPKIPIPEFVKPWLVPSADQGGSAPLVSVLAVLLTLFLLYLLGFFTANVFGRRTLSSLERLVDRVPVAKTVYRATKQIISTVASSNDLSGSRVVMVEFFRPGMKSLGFLTSMIKDKDTGRDLAVVFIATTPNPMVGYTQVMPVEAVSETDLTVEEAVKLVMSGGVMSPSALPFDKMRPPRTDLLRSAGQKKEDDKAKGGAAPRR